MQTLHREITVKAPVEKVFEYLDTPTNLPQIWPSVYEVKDVEKMPNGGYRFAFLYNLAGRPSRGVMETLERVANERIVDKTEGDFESTYEFTFKGENGMTKVHLEEEYETPAYWKSDEPYFAWRNEYEADTIIQSLKAWFERK